MDLEANLSQDIVADDVMEQQPADAPVVQEEASPAEEPTVAEAEAPSADVEEATEAQDGAEPAPEAEAAPEAETAPEAEAAEPVQAVDGTADAAPAKSKIELARIAKEALIERAKELEDSTDWRKTSDAQRALMEEWRAAGYAGKENNDKLWEEFRASRDKFFTRRDEHYTELQLMEAQLQTFRTTDGKPYRLIPLPMAKPAYDEEGNRLPATYANFLIINRAVLMPTYGDKATDQKAEEQLRKAFPHHEIIGIDCRTLITQHGSLHCCTMQFPKETL